MDLPDLEQAVVRRDRRPRGGFCPLLAIPLAGRHRSCRHPWRSQRFGPPLYQLPFPLEFLPPTPVEPLRIAASTTIVSDTTAAGADSFAGPVPIAADWATETFPLESAHAAINRAHCSRPATRARDVLRHDISSRTHFAPETLAAARLTRAQGISFAGVAPFEEKVLVTGPGDAFE